MRMFISHTVLLSKKEVVKIPKEYTECVKSYTKKGVPLKEAKARCAATYYKRHKTTVKEAHKRGRAAADDAIPDYDDELMQRILDTQIIGASQEEDLIKAAENKNVSFESIALAAEDVSDLFPDDFNILTMVSARVGSRAFHEDGIVLEWTKKSLEATAETWVGGTVGANHGTFDGGKILSSRFCSQDENLYQTIMITEDLKENVIRNWPKVGASIEAGKVTYNQDGEIIKAAGTGVSLIFYPMTPRCKPEEGCKILGSENVTEEKKVEAPPEEEKPEEEKEEPKKEEAENAELVAAKTKEIEELTTQLADLKKANEELTAYKEDILSKRKSEIIVRLEGAGLDTEKYKEMDAKALEVFAADIDNIKKKLKDDVEEGCGIEGADLKKPPEGKKTTFDETKERENKLLGYDTIEVPGEEKEN